MLKIGIIGCGKIADDHVSAIQHLPGCTITAVADSEELMAWQLADRLRIKAYFSDARDLLQLAKPDVVHITTPPQSHYALAKLCIESGCHVFIEKPFTVTADEADEILNLADKRGVKVTAGHNHQFSPVALRMRAAICEGALGGRPVHLESMFTYELGDRYAMALMGDKDHWVRRLPGGLLQNVISHPVSKIAEYLSSEIPIVKAYGFQSPQLQRLGASDLIDDLRVIIADEGGASASLTFSSQIKPHRHELRVYGPKTFLVADHSHQTLTLGMKKAYKIQLNSLVPPFLYAKQFLRNGAKNFCDFIRAESPIDSGRRVLLSRFYDCVREGGSPPIPYREISLTARIMDEIFRQLNTRGHTRTIPEENRISQLSALIA